MQSVHKDICGSCKCVAGSCRMQIAAWLRICHVWLFPAGGASESMQGDYSSGCDFPSDKMYV